MKIHRSCYSTTIIYFILIQIFTDVSSIVLEEEGEPIVFQEGSESQVVLDCPYDLEDKDEEGLVVQWQHDSYYLIYQWIPPNGNPSILDSLSNRLDLEYTASENDYKKHRAIKILNPSSDFSGTFTCVVSAFNEEKRYTRKMIAYAPPSEIIFSLDEVNDTHISLFCQVASTYPEPLVTISKSEYGRKTSLRDVQILKSWAVNKFNLTAQADLEDEELHGETLFECKLSLPETPFEVSEFIKYSPTAGIMPYIPVVEKVQQEVEENKEDEVVLFEIEEEVKLEIDRETKGEPIEQQVRSSSPATLQSSNMAVGFLSCYYFINWIYIHYF